jgi:hypothetical protein
MTRAPGLAGRASGALGVVSLLLVCVSASGFAASHMDGQDDPDSGARSTEGSIALVAQDPWVGPDGSFDLRLRLDDAPPDARLAVQVYPSVRSRTAFADSIAGENLGSPLRPILPVLPVSFLPRAGDGSIQLSFPVTTTEPPALGVRVPGQGVYPVLISLLDTEDETLDELVTHLVRLPEADPSARPLAFALVVPFSAQPGFQPNLQATPPEGTDGRLDAVARSLARRPAVPLSVAPTPETVDAVNSSGEAGASIVRALAGSLSGRQVIGGTYGDVDIGDWVASADPRRSTSSTRRRRRATRSCPRSSARVPTGRRPSSIER